MQAKLSKLRKIPAEVVLAWKAASLSHMKVWLHLCASVSIMMFTLTAAVATLRTVRLCEFNGSWQRPMIPRKFGVLGGERRLTTESVGGINENSPKVLRRIDLTNA